MYRAFDVERCQDVVSLDSFDPAELDRLRDRSGEDLIHCPTCKHPVSFKAGTERRRHFAHKHKSDCPSSGELPELTAARAVLYEWLKTKFKEGVTLEQRIAGSELPRAVDCWVSYKNKRFAYWIVTHAIQKPEIRLLIKAAAVHAHADLHFVFLKTMMRRNEAPNSELNLTTTERDFLTESKYDAIYRTGTRSIHYLETDTRILITFRAMRCIEEPGHYKGCEKSTALAEVMVSPANGEFVLSGEHERYTEFEAAEKKRAAEELAQRLASEARLKAEADARARRMEELERIQREREAQRQAEADRRRAAQQNPSVIAADHVHIPTGSSNAGWQTYPYSAPDISVPVAREFPCELCGNLTNFDDSSIWTPKTQSCKCKSCLCPNAPRIRKK